MAKINQTKCSPLRARRPRREGGRPRRAPMQLTAGLAAAVLTLTLTLGLVGASVATAREGAVACDTRTELREVFKHRKSWHHYVVDRVTRCWTPEATVASPAPSSARTSSPVVVVPAIAPADARVEWRDGRTRLTNAQYARSLRAIGDVRSGVNRARR